MKKITLVAPGLIPDTKWMLNEPHTYLSTLLSRASVNEERVCSLEATLKQLFSISDDNLPVAAFIAYYRNILQENERDAHFCCADYVHFQADMHTVFLKSVLNRALETSEHEQIQALIRPYIEPLHQLFALQDEQNLVIRLGENLDIMTNPLWEVLGKSLHMRLPSGPDAAQMQRLMTELQMLLKNAPFNQKRLEQSLATVEGLWLWGFGCLPKKIVSEFDLIMSNESFMGGLAKCAQTTFASLEEEPQTLFQNKYQNVLIVDTRFLYALREEDITQWQQLLKTYEDNYFSVFYHALENKKLSEINFNVGRNKSYTLTRHQLKYFWRRIRSLETFCEA